MTKRIKIGQTTNLTKRLRALQTGSPDQLKVLATIPDEAFDAPYHLKFRESWAGHGEWFHPTPELMEFIQTLLPSTATRIIGNHTIEAQQQVTREWLAERVLAGVRAAKPGSSTQLAFMKQYARLRGWKSWRDVPALVAPGAIVPSSSETRYAN
jgi:hypothetical protein